MVKDMDQYRRDILAAELQYAVNLLQMTSLDKTEVLSPANLSLALTLIQQGTKGETRRKINKVLLNGICDKHFTVNQKFLQQFLQKAENGVVLEIANKLFVADRIKIKDAYKNDLKKNFDAETKMMNFNKASECCEVISKFVHKATRGKISCNIDEKTIRDSCSIIVSVLYAKAAWQKPFKVKYTQMETFTKGDGKTKEILFMSGEFYTAFYEDKDVQILSKTYADEAFQFVWMLPNDSSSAGFKKFRSALSGKMIQEYLSQMKEQRMDVKVPRMKLNCNYDLFSILKHLGLSDLTTHKADFSGITDCTFGLQSGSHSTVLEVDELGTVAVAVTCMNHADYVPSAPPSFHATHPFIFLMHKNQHPIMIGQFNGPQE